MPATLSWDRLKFFLGNLHERLWVKPAVVCLLSIAGAFVATLADGTTLADRVPAIEAESLARLLAIMCSSMLVIATFSVGSMVSAYASAANTATPRSFAVVVSDDASQNALSTFLGAFIFSVVGLTAVTNGYFQAAGLFVLFVQTLLVFAIVVFTFLRWVDRIARLGRMGTTIHRVEQAAAEALAQRRDSPRMGGVPVGTSALGKPVFSARIGYVQHVDMAALQAWAERAGASVVVAALPGTFATPDRPLAHVSAGADDRDFGGLAEAFAVGDERTFREDPRFGLVVLSEIAGRALSPAVNDPGTAIAVAGVLVRLFSLWSGPSAALADPGPEFDRVEVPELSVHDMFDDAFTAMARDGAGTIEVAIRLQKALASLAATGNAAMRDAAEHHARLALKRAAATLSLPEDLQAVEAAACTEARPVSRPASG